MIRPTRLTLLWGALGIALALLPALVSEALWLVWLVFVALSALALGLEWALLPAASALSVQLEAPALLFVGEPASKAQAKVRVGTHAGPVEARLELLAPLAEAPDVRGTLVRDAACALEFPLVSERRGPGVIRALHLRWTGPLGLLFRETTRELDRPLPVTANLRHVRRMALQFFGSRDGDTGLRVERFKGDGSEFDALREFEAGHDRRAIDWKASARHRKLLVREFRAERNHQIIVTLDTGRLMSPPLGGVARLDHAINSALALTWAGLRSGDRVGLFAFDSNVRCWAEPRGGLASFPRVQGLCGSLTEAESETNFSLGLSQLTGKLRRRSLVVLLTEFTDSITAELMLQNVERLTKKHLVLFVALRDAGLDGLVDARPSEIDDLHRAVTAHELQRDRQLVLKRLQRAGALLVDAAPEKLSVELLNRYLEIKRREMI